MSTWWCQKQAFQSSEIKRNPKGMVPPKWKFAHDLFMFFQVKCKNKCHFKLICNKCSHSNITLWFISGVFGEHLWSASIRVNHCSPLLCYICHTGWLHTGTLHLRLLQNYSFTFYIDTHVLEMHKHGCMLLGVFI